MELDILRLFETVPAVLPAYERLQQQILAAFPDVELRVKKTQAGFFHKHGFAWASPPMRAGKGIPKACLIVTFGLSYRLEHPRIFAAVEPYPNRWTHHVIVQNPEEIDSELMGWIGESYRFAQSKGRRGK